MKNVVQIELLGAIFLPNFLKISSSVKKLSGDRMQTHTHEEQGDFVSLCCSLFSLF
jgi:hypothetical protein